MDRLWIFKPATSRDQESVWNPLHDPNEVGRSAIHICIVDARRAHRQLAAQEIVEHGLCPVSIESHLKIGWPGLCFGDYSTPGTWKFHP
jgi:hypothetical protein